MATELELKAVVPDAAAARAALARAGARRAFRGMMRDRRLDRGGELVAREEVLRIRLWSPEGAGEGRAEVAWKGPAVTSPDGYKRRDEFEYEARPADQALATFRALGFEIVHAIDRFVEVYHHDGAMVRLEWYPRMDLLAEIEGSPGGIERSIAALALPRGECLPDPLAAFVARYEARTGRLAVLAEADLSEEVPGWRSA